jgi:hypothetical protein
MALLMLGEFRYPDAALPIGFVADDKGNASQLRQQGIDIQITIEGEKFGSDS